MQTEYPVYEAKAKLSEILRAVKARREIVITERGRKIARVVPFESDEPASLKQQIERLRERGQLHAAQAQPAQVFRGLKVVRQPGALRRFLEDRE